MQNEAIAVIEDDRPSVSMDVNKVSDEGLDLGINVLLESQGAADRDLLAVLLVERHKRARADESAAWLVSCEVLFLLATQTFVDERGETLPLWMKYSQGAGWSWSSFVMDTLNVGPSVATSRKRIWEVFRRRLGWTPEVMARIGPSRLSVSVAEMERSLSEGGDDKLTGMLLGDGNGKDNAGWQDIWLHCQRRGDERRRLAGKPARVKFQQNLVVDESTGEVTGFSIETWYDELVYNLGTFTWNSKLPREIKDVLEGALIDALRRGPRRI